MEYWESHEGDYTTFVRKFLLATGDFFPDGEGKTKWQRLCAKTKMYLWEIPVHNRLYDAKVFDKLLFDSDWRKFNADIAIVACSLNPDQTIYLCNRKSKFLDQSKEPHALWWFATEENNISAAHAAAMSAAIPGFFGGEYTHFRPSAQSELKYSMIDGAITNNFHWAANADKRVLGVSTHPRKEAEWEEPKKWNSCNWWLVGFFVKLWRAVFFMMQDKMQDRQGYYMQKDFNAYQDRILCELDGDVIRKEENLPSWINFSAHTKGRCSTLFNRGILKGQGCWDDIPDDKKMDWCSGYSLSISGGGCDGYIQCGAVCGFEQRRQEYYKKSVAVLRKHGVEDYKIPKLGRIGLITGTSAGAINALFFGWVNEMWFNNEEEV